MDSSLFHCKFRVSLLELIFSLHLSDTLRGTESLLGRSRLFMPFHMNEACYTVFQSLFGWGGVHFTNGKMDVYSSNSR